jgi:hypothetical protein
MSSAHDWSIREVKFARTLIEGGMDLQVIYALEAFPEHAKRYADALNRVREEIAKGTFVQNASNDGIGLRC